MIKKTIIAYEKVAMLFKFVVGCSHPEKFLSVGSVSFLDVVHKINSKNLWQVHL